MPYKFHRYQNQTLTVLSEIPEEMEHRSFGTMTVPAKYVVKDSHLTQPHHVNNISDIDELSIEYQNQFVTISDDEIMMGRVASLMTKGRGDVQAELLAEKLPDGAEVMDGMYNEGRGQMYMFYVIRDRLKTGES